MTIRYEQTQKQTHVLSEKVRLSLSVLQVSADLLYEYMAEYLSDNPLAEPVRTDVPMSAYLSARRIKGRMPDDSERARLFDPADEKRNGQTLSENLCEQLGLLSLTKKQYACCWYIISNLSEKGYLDEPLSVLKNDRFTVEDLKEAHQIVRTMSPAGVGAINLEDCLLLQLKRNGTENRYTRTIVKKYLTRLANCDYGELGLLLGITEDKAKKYGEAVRSLTPYPASGFSSSEAVCYVIPDALINIENGVPAVYIPDSYMPKVVWNDEYLSMLAETSDKELRRYLLLKKKQAEALIQDIDGRKATLIRVIRYAVTRQREYLLGQVDYPVPLTISETAAALSLHVSTVSRAVRNKRLACPQGVIAMKDLFPRPVSGAAQADRKMIGTILWEAVRNEHAPLSDSQLQEILADRGIRLSRRSVTLYRTQCGIPRAFERKHMRK